MGKAAGEYRPAATLLGRCRDWAEEKIYDLNERDHWLFRVYDWANEIWATLFFRGVRRRASEIDQLIEGKSATARLRFLQPEDIDEFAALLASFDAKYLPPHRLDRKAAERALRRRSYLPFGIYDGDTLVGYQLLRLFFPWRAVTGIWTKPAQHDKGIGSAGVAATAAFTRSEGLADYATIAVDNENSVKMAQNGGWRIIRTNRRFHVLLRQ